MKSKAIEPASRKSANISTRKTLSYPQQPKAEDAWARFTSELAGSLGDLDEDEFLTLSTKKNGYYVQFSAQGSFGMRAEAISNAYLDDATKLPREAHAKLLKLGWNAPTKKPPKLKKHLPDGSPNYFLDIDRPVPYGDLAEVAVSTLRDVFGAVHPGVLQYTAFVSQSKGGSSIRFPDLRIARERTEAGARQSPLAAADMTPVTPAATPTLDRAEGTRLIIQRALLTRMVCRELVENEERAFSALRLLDEWILSHPHCPIPARPAAGIDSMSIPDDCLDLLEEIRDGEAICDDMHMRLSADNESEVRNDMARIQEGLENYWSKHRSPAVPRSCSQSMIAKNIQTTKS